MAWNRLTREQSVGYYECLKCRKETTYVLKVTRDGMPYQMNVCEDCEWATGPIDRPELKGRTLQVVRHGSPHLLDISDEHEWAIPAHAPNWS